MEFITTIIASQIFQYAAGSIGAIILAWIFKKIPNDTIKRSVGLFAYNLGVVCTLGLSKWKFTKRFWNKIIEPWVIDFIDNVAGEFVREFIRGLRSDNETPD